jgi:hypothetical protein
MKLIIALPKVFFIIAVLLYAGCESQPDGAGQLSFPLLHSDADLYACYGPVKIDILPITTLAPAAASSGDFTINAYVCLVDSFGSQIKSPATFRFELFQYVQRSKEPKGKRIVIWPDLNLNDLGVNNKHWQDFLRAYQFTLPLQKPSVDTCILQVTCLPPSGKRLTADFLIQPNPQK